MFVRFHELLKTKKEKKSTSEKKCKFNNGKLRMVAVRDDLEKERNYNKTTRGTNFKVVDLIWYRKKAKTPWKRDALTKSSEMPFATKKTLTCSTK
uniref:Uncharacterized protein n=1 Tax=Acrobeloides nanus TaxID=290746 RepID=A0A914DMN5_9BILA